MAFVAAATVAAVILCTGTASAAPTQDFTLRQDSLTGPTTVVARGVINATGRDVPLSDTRDRFVFPAGNLIVTHVPKSQRESSHDCVFRFHEEGTYRIVSGTGAYRGAEGRGTYEVDVVQRGCNPNHPREFHVRIDADGTIDLD
jgi:hypothetical protein